MPRSDSQPKTADLTLGAQLVVLLHTPVRATIVAGRPGVPALHVVPSGCSGYQHNQSVLA